jgi:hypothetical protein
MSGQMSLIRAPPTVRYWLPPNNDPESRGATSTTQRQIDQRPVTVAIGDRLRQIKPYCVLALAALGGDFISDWHRAGRR